jgi:glycopeptide antibiotics resistance protein
MNKRALNIFCIACFVAYLALLAKLIVFKYPGAMTREILRTWSVEGLARHVRSANLIPFQTISSSLFNRQLRIEIAALVFNVAAFVPLGFLLPCINRNARRWGAALVAGLSVSLAVEFVQLVTILGSADIDDVILNVTGAMIGYGLFRLADAAYWRIDKPARAAGGEG